MRTIALLLFLAAATPAMSANFVGAEYDPQTDELVVTLVYRGTHPDHEFSLTWDPCQQASTDSADAKHEVAGRVLDRHWDDVAHEEFKKTVRFPLTGLACRPATVTLFTEPNFRISVFVPKQAESS